MTSRAVPAGSGTQSLLAAALIDAEPESCLSVRLGRADSDIEVNGLFLRAESLRALAPVLPPAHDEPVRRSARTLD